MSRAFLGEFEQMVLLSILRMGEQAYGLEVRRELEKATDRRVSRGGFYTTLDRLERKNYLSWTTRIAGEGRGGMPQRHFTVSPAGIRELRRSREALLNLWRGGVLEPR